MTAGQKLAKRAAEVCEVLAEKEFSTAVVLAAAAEAAATGLLTCEIRPSKPIDVRKTKTLEATVQELRRERIHIEWIARRDAPDQPEYLVLLLNWRGADGG